MQDAQFDLHWDDLARSEYGEFIQVVIELVTAAKSERAWKDILAFGKHLSVLRYH